MDIISHYAARGNDKFVDCCWLANESDGYLAILLESGDIELLSLSYSSIISIINLPGSIKISSKPSKSYTFYSHNYNFFY